MSLNLNKVASRPSCFVTDIYTKEYMGERLLDLPDMRVISGFINSSPPAAYNQDMNFGNNKQYSDNESNVSNI